MWGSYGLLVKGLPATRSFDHSPYLVMRFCRCLQPAVGPWQGNCSTSRSAAASQLVGRSTVYGSESILGALRPDLAQQRLVIHKVVDTPERDWHGADAPATLSSGGKTCVTNALTVCNTGAVRRPKQSKFGAPWRLVSGLARQLSSQEANLSLAPRS